MPVERPAAHRARAIALHVLLPLAVGAAIYLGWRTDTLVGWRWADALGLGDVGHAARDALRATIELPSAIRLTLPDALWVYALAWSIARLHRSSPGRERALFLALPVLLGPGAELAQLAQLLPGTFDLLDLLATSVALAVGLALGLRSPRDRSESAPLPRLASTPSRTMESS